MSDDAKELREAVEFGPKMAALSAKRRALVMALFADDAPKKGEGLLVFAAQRAGYGTPTSSAKSLGVIAGRIVHDDAVQAAIAEHSHRVMRARNPPDAIRALKALIADPGHRDHMKAIAAVIDRTDPLQTLHKVQVEDTRPPSVEATKEVLDRIEHLMARAGMLKPAPTIDGDFKVLNGNGAAS